MCACDPHIYLQDGKSFGRNANVHVMRSKIVGRMNIEYSEIQQVVGQRKGVVS